MNILIGQPKHEDGIIQLENEIKRHQGMDIR